MAKAIDPKEIGAEARQAINAVVDALAEWRDEVGASTERFSETVLDRMVTAARAAGWPEEIIEASRTHLTRTAKIQTQMIDQLMAAWQEQMKSPFSGQFLTRPYDKAFDLAPGMDAATPFQFWMQAATAWQRHLASAWSTWSGTGTSRPH